MESKINKADDGCWSFEIKEGKFLLAEGSEYKTKKSMQKDIKAKLDEFKRIDAVIDESGLFKK